MKAWKAAIEALGFRRWRYEKVCVHVRRKILVSDPIRLTAPVSTSSLNIFTAWHFVPSRAPDEWKTPRMSYAFDVFFRVVLLFRPLKPPPLVPRRSSDPNDPSTEEMLYIPRDNAINTIQRA